MGSKIDMKETLKKEVSNNVFTVENEKDSKEIDESEMNLIGDLYFLLWDEYKFQIGRRTKRAMYNNEGKFAQDVYEVRRKLAILFEILYKSEKGLNLFEQKEVRIIYNGKEGYSNFNSNEAANKCLIKDMVYTLKDIVPYEEFATVELVEYPEYKYCASSFYIENVSKRNVEELLSEYGSSLQEELNKIRQLINQF